MEDSPVAKIHELAQSAETHVQRNQLPKALALYLELLDRLPKVIDNIDDPQVVDTLTMMQKTYERSANDIQRRVRREEQQLQLQQQTTITTSTPPVSFRGNKSKYMQGSSTNLANSYASLNRAKMRNSVSSVHAIPPRPMNRATSAKSMLSHSTASLPAARPPMSMSSLGTESTSLNTLPNKSNDSSTVLPLTQPLSGHNALNETGYTNEPAERPLPSWDGSNSSYMVLPGRNVSTDPFEKFWEAVESLMDRISNPVALSTVPLYDSEYMENMRQNLAQAQVSIYQQPSMFASAPSSQGSQHLPPLRIVQEEGVVSNAAAMEELLSTQHGSDSPSEELDMAFSGSPTHRTMSDSFCLVDRPSSLNGDGRKNARPSIDNFIYDGAHTAGCNSTLIRDAIEDINKPFLTINTNSQKSVEEYALENEQLKQMVDMLSNRVVALEKSEEENAVFRNNLDNFREGIKKQAQVLLQSQDLVRSSLLQRSMGSNELSVAQLQRRIQELEDEVRDLSAIKDKQAVTIAKFKRNWHRIKESAKQKQETDLNPLPIETSANHTVSEPIADSIIYTTTPSMPS
ncbi:hypothetical protein BDF19DRAFT_448035 [Syncephalis fuscata]|nr:hypothetical protein BDF19DRAFT_448035 [Syncephalis fuscata]